MTYDRFESYAHAGVTLAIGQTVRLNVVLRPAGVIESIAVSAQPPPLDPRQTSVATTIDTERIEELPVRSRNYLEFALLAPGVTRSGAQTEPGVLSSTLSDSGFSFGGLRPRSNTLTIDGLDNNDEFTGDTRTELSLEFVREFQVVSNGWAVENGGGSGGGINVVTKSGANTLDGDVFLFGQSGVFNASPKLEERSGIRRRWDGIAAGWQAADRSSRTARSITPRSNASRHTPRRHRISILLTPPPSMGRWAPDSLQRSTHDS